MDKTELMRVALEATSESGSRIECVETPPGPGKRVAVHPQKTEDELGWKARHRSVDSIRDEANWCPSEQGIARPLAREKRLRQMPWKFVW